MEAVKTIETIATIATSAIVGWEGNREIDWETVKGIASTFPEVGLLTPIKVRAEGDKYVVIDGHHRFEAVKLVGWEMVVVSVRQPCDIAKAAIEGMVANTHRKQMTWSEKVSIVRHILATDNDVEPSSLARKVAVSTRIAAEFVYISELPQDLIQKADKDITFRSALYRFARLPLETRTMVAENIQAHFDTSGDWVSAAMMNNAVDKTVLGLEGACFDTSECVTCPYNTNCQTSLFQDEGEALEGVCGNASCFNDKKEKALADALNLAVEEHGGESVVYEGDGLITTSHIQIGEVHLRPWVESELSEPSGCQGCAKRCVAAQAAIGRVVTQVMCADEACYDKLGFEPVDDVDVEGSGEGGEVEVVAGDAPESDAKPTKPSEAKAKKATVPVFEKNKVTDEFHRATVQKLAAESVAKACEAGRFTEVLIGVNNFIQAEHGGSSLSFDCGAEVNQDLNDINGVVGDMATLLQGALTKSNVSLSTVEATLLQFMSPSDYAEAFTFQDKEFLTRLTRASLLGLLEMAGGAADEELWTKATKAKKPDLVDVLMEFETDFLPDLFNPYKEK